MIHCLSSTSSLVPGFSWKHVLFALLSCAVNKIRSTFAAEFVAARDCIVGTAPESSGLFAFSAPFLLYETFFVTIRRKVNVANNRMLRQLYELGPLHLSKFYPLLPQISVFWQLMHSIACFVRITAKLNYTAFYRYEDVALFQKKPCKHELISQRVQERQLASGNQRSTRDVICKIAQFKMADVKNFEAIFQYQNWLK